MIFTNAKRSTLLGGKRRTNVINMGEPSRKKTDKLAKIGQHDTQLGRVAHVKQRGGGNPLI